MLNISPHESPSLVSVAPMMDYTDRHNRYFLRIISPDILLYTEMINAQALLHGDANYLLGFHPAEHPVILQLGGNSPTLLAEAAKIGESFGYAGINLNVGCPSPRVSAGRFGACLMLEPTLVAECVAAMQANVRIPITVKCRTGVDERDDYADLYRFIETVASAGCQTFIIHARKAWLQGLSPRQNREIPPLCYEVVHQVKKDFPHLFIIINGGIKTLADIAKQLPLVDGVMIGRVACSNPYLLAEAQAAFYPNNKTLSRDEIIRKFIPYVREQCQNKIKLSNMTRHILGLFQGQRGAAIWRRHLSERAHQSGVEVIEEALQLVMSRS